MERPEVNGWQVITNENGVKMAILPRDTMEALLKYAEYAEKQLRIADVSSSFKVGTYTITTEDMADWCHWSEGLKMVIEKDGVVMKLEGEEIKKIVKSLPRTFGGTY